MKAFDEELYSRGMIPREDSPPPKALIAVGDWTVLGPWRWNMALTEEDRATFIQSAKDFIDKFVFDGMYLALEYHGRAAYTANCVSLVRKMKSTLSPTNLPSSTGHHLNWAGRSFSGPMCDFVGGADTGKKKKYTL